ncbi:MAG TPA: hypothetical protein VM901_06835 [Bdellovibrionota bacterium]|jgi:hypothetical protein|nr:hypothetical protein [Bdellovibrionota bacterium]
MERFFKIITLSLAFLGAQNAVANGSPRPPATEEPDVSEPEVPTAPPVVIDTDKEFLSVASGVDKSKGLTELQKTRTMTGHASDSCEADLRAKEDPFGLVIGRFVEEEFEAAHPEVSYIASAYSLDTTRLDAVGFDSHPMCTVSASSLTSTLRYAELVPAQSVIDQANAFAAKYNALRTKSLAGDDRARQDLMNLWAKLFSCLSYSESLTTADTARSRDLASQVAPSGYKKPDGVKFYYDEAQVSDASKLNIGMYQFSPGASGNIQACIREWNERYSRSSCQVSRTASNAEMIRVLGSSQQHFNAFCGVNKALQSFYVQVNTTAALRTHPANKLSSGALKAPQDRCVSLHFHSTRSYNHFGPFQNSTKTNLKTLLSCVMN